MSKHSGKEKLPFKRQKPRVEALGGRPSALTGWVERQRERQRAREREREREKEREREADRQAETMVIIIEI